MYSVKDTLPCDFKRELIHNALPKSYMYPLGETLSCDGVLEVIHDVFPEPYTTSMTRRRCFQAVFCILIMFLIRFLCNVPTWRTYAQLTTDIAAEVELPGCLLHE